MGLRQLENAAKKLAITLDQASVVARAANATRDRRVSLRPAPDTMTWLGALLPVKDGVAVYAALDQAAKAAHAAGDERSRGQVMADTLVDRVTGREAGGAKPRIEVKIVMTADSLTNTGDQPALVEGYGPVPAAWAREALADAEVFVRRLFTDPAGRLVAMESRSRKAPDGLAEFIATRDGGICSDQRLRRPDPKHRPRRTPRRRRQDQRREPARPVRKMQSGQGSLGWRARPGPDGSIITTTPTGHTYISPPPDTWRTRSTTVAGRAQAARRTPHSHPRGLIHRVGCTTTKTSRANDARSRHDQQCHAACRDTDGEIGQPDDGEAERRAQQFRQQNQGHRSQARSYRAGPAERRRTRDATGGQSEQQADRDGSGQQPRRCRQQRVTVLDGCRSSARDLVDVRSGGAQARRALLGVRVCQNDHSPILSGRRER